LCNPAPSSYLTRYILEVSYFTFEIRLYIVYNVEKFLIPIQIILEGGRQDEYPRDVLRGLWF
jgi:hypothetical protein